MSKCDLIRPSCSCCSRRELACTGYPADEGFIFRDENLTAQRASERARRDHSQAFEISFEAPSQLPQVQQAESSTPVLDPSIREHFPWLSEAALVEVPRPITRDIESRAVERFFDNWILAPCNHGTSPGYMHELPTLYLSAPPDSILRHAVRALAYADMKGVRCGDSPFHIKARTAYGAALTRMRGIANDKQELVNDRTLAALLLIDDFELMYLARNIFLGPHSDAVKHVLRTRGEEQLFNRSAFAVARRAHHRLLSRQILLSERPDPEQIAWLGKLNVNRPDIHINADVLRMNILISEAKELMQRPLKTDKATLLAQRMQTLVSQIESWLLESSLMEVWKPKAIDPQQVVRPRDVSPFSEDPMSHFICPRILAYHDIWLAYMWNFHAASQIVLRETFVRVLKYIAAQQGQELSPGSINRIEDERKAVESLSRTIVRSIPPLLGFKYAPQREPYSIPHGKMAGRFFSLFSMWVLERSEFTLPEHKQIASSVTKWIHMHHGLG